MHVGCPCRRSVPSRYVLRLLPVGQKRPRGPKPMLDRRGNKGIPAGGDRSYIRSNNQRTYYFLLFYAFCIWLVMLAMCVLCSFVSHLHACYVCKCMFHILISSNVNSYSISFSTLSDMLSHSRSKSLRAERPGSSETMARHGATFCVKRW